MQTLHKALRVSAYTSGLVTLISLTLVFSSWFAIQTLVVLIDLTS